MSEVQRFGTQERLGPLPRSYPETRIGAFDFSAATCTEPLRYGSADGQRACGDSWRGVTEDLFLFTQEDPMAPTDGPSLYRYVRNSPVPFTDPEGAQSVAKGHHYVPKEVFRNIPGLSEEARQVFIDSTTDILPKGSHYYDRAHRAYTAGVRDLWSDWMTQRGIVPSKMSSSDALAFLNELRRSRDPRITNYIRHLNLAAFRNALHFRSLRKLVRGGAAFLCPIDPVGMLLDLMIDDYDQALADAQPLLGIYAPYLVVPPKEIY